MFTVAAFLMPRSKYEGWEKKKMSIKELACLIHATGEPVLFLNGNPEFRLKALAEQKYLSSVVTIKSKKYLNDIKKREDRPVAPICLEEFAPQIFTPGYSDQFMLFDHFANDNWKKQIPAVCHLDGIARL